MRMPGRPFRLARRVLHLSHLIHVHERIEVREVHSREGPSYRKPFALQPARCHNHLAHGSLTRRLVGTGQAVELGEVFDGDRRHRVFSSSPGG
jgi:hypothetical protein